MPILDKLPRKKWLPIIDGGILYKLAVVWDALPSHILTNNLQKYFTDILDTLGTNKFIFVLEGGHNFRHAIYPEYKSGRKDPPESLRYIQNWAKSVGGISYTSLEADDVIKILHKYYTELKGELTPIIVSEDKDMTQCGGYRYIPSNGKRETAFVYTSKEDALKYAALQFAMGDNADHVKGLKGIGEGKAQIILAEYEKYKKGELSTTRKINSLMDYIFYKYQQQYGLSLKAALYAINENYNMIRLLPSHVKINPAEIQIQEWTTTI